MTAGTHLVALQRIAHCRAGDKGNRLNVSVIAYRSDVWSILLEQVTKNRVFDLFRHRGATSVERYELPKLEALNFVIDDVLEGGVNSGLNLDTHGKTNSFLLLAMEVEVPLEIFEELSSGPQGKQLHRIESKRN